MYAKNIISKLLKRSMLLSMFLFVTSLSNAQKNVEIYAGVGAFELFHAGANYQFGKLSIGASAGFNHDKNCTDLTIAGNVYYYMFGKSKHCEKLPWFTRLNVIYVRTDEDNGRSSFNALSPRIGREFYLFNEGGFRVDVGINYCFNTNENIVGDVYIDVNDISPAMSVLLFYRF